MYVILLLNFKIWHCKINLSKKDCTSYTNIIAELALGKVLVSDEKQVALQFASYVSESEPGHVESHYFSNIINKCTLLVTR